MTNGDPYVSDALWDRVADAAKPQLPSPDQCKCFGCGRPCGYPHFSLEEKPKIFCTWFCASKFHRANNTGIYSIEKKVVTLVETPLVNFADRDQLNFQPVYASVEFKLDMATGRPPNHPVRD